MFSSCDIFMYLPIRASNAYLMLVYFNENSKNFRGRYIACPAVIYEVFSHAENRRHLFLVILLDLSPFTFGRNAIFSQFALYVCH